MRIGLYETYGDVFGSFGGVYLLKSGFTVHVVLDDMKLVVGFGVMWMVGDGFSVEPTKKMSQNLQINRIESEIENASDGKWILFHFMFGHSPIPYGPRTITVGAGVLEPILSMIGASDDCGRFGVVYDETGVGFLVVDKFGREGVGPLT